MKISLLRGFQWFCGTRNKDFGHAATKSIEIALVNNLLYFINKFNISFVGYEMIPPLKIRKGEPKFGNTIQFVNGNMRKSLFMLVARNVIANNEAHGLMSKDFFNRMALLHRKYMPQEPFTLRISKQVHLIRKKLQIATATFTFF